MKQLQILSSLWLILSTAVIQPLWAQEPLKADTTIVLDRAIQQPALSQVPVQRQSTFEFKAKKDIPIMVGGAAMVISGFIMKAQVDPLTEAELATLDPSSINAFDRGATRNLRELDSHLSDYLLVFSAITPISVLAARPIRKEATAVAVMIFETAALTGGLTNFSKGLFKRKRPYVYNPNADLADRTKVSARHSFFSGHVANSAAFMYLTAYMVDRYAQRPAWKWAAWSGAVIIPGTIAYWRYSAGKHFPSDVLVGYAVGAGCGIFIPWLHRQQLPKATSLNIMPTPYGLQLSLTF